jgi:signal transduction histidine kinase
VQAKTAMTVSDTALVGNYDYRVVALSVVIGVLGSYAALDLAERLTAARGRARFAWLAGGATAQSIGIWSMHYTGMLAFRLSVPTWYDWPAALLSFLPAMLGAVAELVIVSQSQMGARRLLGGSVFKGSAIVGLHYTAMMSMRFQGMCRYSPAIVTLSVVFAIGFAWLSLWLMLFFRGGSVGRQLRRIGSALLMGAAICLMHYTGMAAVTFTRSSAPPELSHALPVSFIGILAIGSIALTVIGVVVVTSMFDRLHQHRELLRVTSQQLRALSASVSSAREDEGIRIARELHDELGSALTSLKWDLETVSSAVSDSLEGARVEEIRRRMAAMTVIIDAMIGRVRRIAADLRPSVLDDLGLPDAIEWQVQQFQARTGIASRCECTPEPVPLTKEQSIQVFRILQEALTNILRHASASRVDVWAGVEAGVFTLRVRDNGRGISDEERSAVRSLGILGMRERAALVGATFDITGLPGQGTTITVRVPLRPAVVEARP